MNELSFFSKLKKLKTDLSGMSYKDKLVHIWTYYKWVIPVLLVVIMLVSVLIASIGNLNKVKVMAGISINVDLSDEGEAYLREEYKEHLGLTSKKQLVVLSETQIEDMVSAANYTDNYYALMSLIALCSNQEVDYMILDDVAVRTLTVHGAFMDLTKVFTQEELDAMGSRVTYIEDKETQNKWPAVLNITDTPFVQAHAPKEETVFFAFVANTPHLEETKALYEYLLAWKAE